MLLDVFSTITVLNFMGFRLVLRKQDVTDLVGRNALSRQPINFGPVKVETTLFETNLFKIQKMIWQINDMAKYS